MTNNTSIQTGTIFVDKWGFEQTNVNFYQVVSATAKTVVIREIRSSVSDTGNMTYTALPIRDDFKGAQMRKKILTSTGTLLLKIQYSYARLWDGKPQHGSSYA